MDSIEFQPRQLTGNRAARLLKEGVIPAVVYNSKGESHNIQITNAVAENLQRTATSTTILDAQLEGKGIKVMVKDIDVDPRIDTPRHISFFQIDENAPMIFTVPFNLIGVSPAVKNNLGVLVKALSSIDVRGKMADLVPAIEIDISTLEHPGQSISVSDIALPNGLELPNEDHAHSAIVTITQLQKEEDLSAPVVAEGEEAATEGETEEGETPAQEATEAAE